MNKLKRAERFFLNIVNSKERYYSRKYYNSSDIPGDVSANIYGYGSLMFNYKNSASIYLAKICIEQKRFAEAFRHIENATKKYTASYSCGTGFNRQKEEYDFLYACCYEGLKKYNKVLDILLPECLNRNDQISIRVIKKMYSPRQIVQQLQYAENSIQCSLDSFPSYSYLERDAQDGHSAKTDTLTYYSGSASMKLFGKKIGLSSPNLENGEHATREQFVNAFKESGFYLSLKEQK